MDFQCAAALSQLQPLSSSSTGQILLLSPQDCSLPFASPPNQLLHSATLLNFDFLLLNVDLKLAATGTYLENLFRNRRA
ncbi:hypothetical protein ACTXT7_005119 [Hymenolepis weldensis]